MSDKIGEGTGRSLWECVDCHTVKVASNEPTKCHACGEENLQITKVEHPQFKKLRL